MYVLYVGRLYLALMGEPPIKGWDMFFRIYKLCIWNRKKNHVTIGLEMDSMICF